ncbi:unnamed protein product [Closterium sp. Naga37s-1]|nr:unnamed protein product [Closterium sp. Naga37s-1]
MAAPKEISSNKMFGGVNKRYEHESATLGCTMKFSIYFPPAATSSRVPVIYWLSGLTCTDENFIQKSFAQKYASEHGVALIVPDTSPREHPHPPPPHLNPSLCTRRPGNARKPASEHGVALIVPDTSPQHGVALIVPDTSPRKLPHPPPPHLNPSLCTRPPGNALKPASEHGVALIVPDTSPPAVQAPSPSHSTFPARPSRPQSTGSRSLSPTPRPSVSAFAPICNPTECPWGQKAFTGYLGDDKAAWEEYDATALGKQFPGLPALAPLPHPSPLPSSAPLPLHACPALSGEYDATALVKQYPGPKVDILIDQGDSDKFDHEKQLLPEVVWSGDSDKFYHEKQLLPENFQKACTEAGVPLTLRFQGGYDHSYFFIASFIGDHIKHHAKALKA